MDLRAVVRSERNHEIKQQQSDRLITGLSLPALAQLLPPPRHLPILLTQLAQEPPQQLRDPCQK